MPSPSGDGKGSGRERRSSRLNPEQKSEVPGGEDLSDAAERSGVIDNSIGRGFEAVDDAADEGIVCSITGLGIPSEGFGRSSDIQGALAWIQSQNCLESSRPRDLDEPTSQELEQQLGWLEDDEQRFKLVEELQFDLRFDRVIHKTMGDVAGIESAGRENGVGIILNKPNVKDRLSGHAVQTEFVPQRNGAETQKGRELDGGSSAVPPRASFAEKESTVRISRSACPSLIVRWQAKTHLLTFLPALCSFARWLLILIYLIELVNLFDSFVNFVDFAAWCRKNWKRALCCGYNGFSQSNHVQKHTAKLIIATIQLIPIGTIRGLPRGNPTIVQDALEFH